MKAIDVYYYTEKEAGIFHVFVDDAEISREAYDFLSAVARTAVAMPMGSTKTEHGTQTVISVTYEIDDAVFELPYFQTLNIKI